ncbi:glycoside hydrolase 61 [Penicillium macrosclerotiorum]|uniref:glycoside hydrolase 61 n=1 Tax=Penicillium macrosclerotiorum TaxID=303699 RepID=UPI002546C561|nr:glycoside hydrolase 61 [Penicillium macrosclerotiorum]KAJ5691779.1 glycoside hydrolase 61 [Penicillium macrosclerotiorum]
MQGFVLLYLATCVVGHGHISNIVINGVSYEGWDINVFPYESDPPTVVAWGTPNTGNGFITPENYGTSDIICHLNATNAKGHAAVAAGDKINLQWTTWPDSHHGPVITYLADCGDSCETVDKTTLEFFKISGVGLVDDTTVPGTWGDDQLIANSNSWLVEIPPTIAPGYYVLRNEIIALHSAEAENGAQNYPQCFNLQVTGSGTDQPSGVLGTELYSPTDAGIYVNIYSSLSTYVVPGPTLYSGAVSVTQTTSSITASGTPTTGSSGSSGSGSVTSSASSSSTTSSSTQTTSQPTTLTTQTSTTLKTSTTSTTTSSTTTVASNSSTQSVYGQCGGSNWTGATACNTAATCTSMNPYYSQCVPTAA